MSDPLDGLCDYHELVIARCLAHTGHADDSAPAERLRNDLQRVCGTYCPTEPNQPKEMGT